MYGTKMLQYICKIFIWRARASVAMVLIISCMILKRITFYHILKYIYCVLFLYYHFWEPITWWVPIISKYRRTVIQYFGGISVALTRRGAQISMNNILEDTSQFYSIDTMTIEIKFNNRFHSRSHAFSLVS